MTRTLARRAPARSRATPEPGLRANPTTGSGPQGRRARRRRGAPANASSSSCATTGTPSAAAARSDLRGAEAPQPRRDRERLDARVLGAEAVAVHDAGGPTPRRRPRTSRPRRTSERGPGVWYA